jgi:hypothetical protein
MKGEWIFLLGIALFPAVGHSQKVFLNPSNQIDNEVAGGGTEAQFALINANNAADVLKSMGFQVIVDQDFTNAPYHANSWGADVFVSVHSNAGGGHGTETLFKTEGGKKLAQTVQNGLLSFLPYQSRGLKQRTDLYVLNTTQMFACLAEVVFHDCTAESGYQGHPPSESSFLRSNEGQTKIGNGLAVGTCGYFRDNCTIQGTGPTTGFFKGVVYVAPDMNQRIEDALVTLNTGQTFVSTADGYFEFEVPAGIYTATAHKEGFYDNRSTRQVVAGQDVWGNIGLSPISSPDTVEGDGHAEPDTVEGDGHAEQEVVGVEETAFVELVDAWGEEVAEGAPEEGIWVWKPPERSEFAKDVAPTLQPEETCPRCSCTSGCSAGAGARAGHWLALVLLASFWLFGRRKHCRTLRG